MNQKSNNGTGKEFEFSTDEMADVNRKLEDYYVQPVNDFFHESVFLPQAPASIASNYDSKSIDQFMDYMKSGTVLRVSITSSDNHGNLHVPLSGNLLGIIPNNEVNGIQYDARKRAMYVGQTFGVVVTNVESNEGKVYMSRVKAKDKVRDILRQKLTTGSIVKARVLFVKENNQRIFVDIEGCNLLGYVPVSEWTHGFVYDPVSQIEKNSIVTIQIKKYLPPRNIEGRGKIGEAYICSRKAVLSDPWVGIEERFPKNSILIVEARDLHAKKFFGPVPGMDIDIYVEYPENDGKSESEKIIINKGHRYKVRVYSVNEKKKILRARVISEVSDNRDPRG